MKIALVRGPHLNPWELQSYAPLAKNHYVVAVGANWQFYQGVMNFPGIKIEKAKLWGASLANIHHTAPVILNRALSWTTGRSFGLKNLEEVVGKPDILHSAELHSTMTHQCLKLKRKYGIPVVVTVWENILHQGELHPLRKRRKREAIINVDRFLAVTETTRRMLMAEGVPPDRIEVILMGVDLKRFLPTPRDPALANTLGIDMNDFVILFIGRLVPEKGVATLLRAIPRVLKNNGKIQFRFCFVGSGPLKSNILKTRSKFPGTILLHPFVPYDSIPKLHNLADIFVLPSIPVHKWAEQFGYVLIESMACGKPILATRSGSIPDVTGEAAMLVEPAQPCALAEAFRTLITMKEKRAALGRVALQRACEVFNAEQNASLIESFYQRALERARR